MSSIKALVVSLSSGQRRYRERRRGESRYSQAGTGREGGREKISHSKRASALRRENEEGEGNPPLAEQQRPSESTAASPCPLSSLPFSSHFDFIFAQIARNFRRIGVRTEGVRAGARIEQSRSPGLSRPSRGTGASSFDRSASIGVDHY